MPNPLSPILHIGTALGPWTAFRDRFASYRDSAPLIESIYEAGSIPGIEAVDVSRGYLPEDLTAVKKALAENKLVVSAVGTALSKDPRTRRGTFSSEDPQVRRLTIGIVKECMDIAAELGSDKVLLWFGQDGYDYHFEMDYQTRWDRLVEGLRESAKHRRDVRICIEYKAREPKIHQLVNSAATALLLIDEAAQENVGVLFDIGHAMLADEMLAETAALLARKGKLWHVHLNDNYFHADTDLIPGTVHIPMMVELFYWLRRLGYEGYMCYDTVALIHDPKAVITECVRFTKAMIAAADRIDRERLEEAFTTSDAPAGLGLFREALFGDGY